MNTTDLDNIADAITYLRDQWDRQLREEYERGYTLGRIQGHSVGFKEGRTAALEMLVSFVAQGKGLEPSSPVDAEPEPILIDAPAPTAAVPPGLQRALEYVREHPGVTSAKAYRDLKNNSTLYTLAKRGLIEKRGTQFYPKDEF